MSNWQQQTKESPLQKWKTQSHVVVLYCNMLPQACIFYDVLCDRIRNSFTLEQWYSILWWHFSVTAESQEYDVQFLKNELFIKTWNTTLELDVSTSNYQLPIYFHMIIQYNCYLLMHDTAPNAGLGLDVHMFQCVGIYYMVFVIQFVNLGSFLPPWHDLLPWLSVC